MITEGTHSAQLIQNDGEWFQSNRAQTGTPQILLSFQTADGEHIQGFFALSPAAIQYTMEKLHNCGFTGTSLRAMASQTPHGKVELVVVEDEYKGKRTMKIKFINRAGGLSIKKEERLSVEELDEISATLAPFDAGFDQAGPPSETKPKHTTVKAGKGRAGDDNIPF